METNQIKIMKIYFNNGRRLSVSEEKLAAILKEMAYPKHKDGILFFSEEGPIKEDLLDIDLVIKLGDISFIK